jgi:hypothetical protein
MIMKISKSCYMDRTEKIMNARQTVDSISKVSLKSCSVLNPLMPEVTAQCMLQNTSNLNGHPLLSTFLYDEFR